MPDPVVSDPAQTTPKKRGPNTPEGKARSSMNALKHGLRSKRFLLLPEEDPEDFASLVSDIRAAYGPEDAVELAHVEAIAVAMWREIRADRVETEVMAGNLPGMKGHGHGTDLYGREERAALTTALRYRTHAQMETKRATDLFWCHRKARLAELLEPAVEVDEDVPAPAGEAAALCTNEFPAEPAPPPSAPEPVPAATAEACTNEFEPAPVTAEPPRTNELATTDKKEEEPDPEDLSLLAEYRALRKTSATRAWIWLQGLPPVQLARLQALVANEPGLDLVAR